MHWGSGSTKAKPEMEDSHIMIVPFQDPSKALFCVFDGHAGKDCAVAAAEILPKELAKRLDQVGDLIDLTDLLKELFLAVDQELLSFEFLGCTATMVLVRKIGEDRYVQAANVGDSSAFLLRGEHALPISKDHKASDQEERERIIASGIPMLKGQTRVGGLAVSRALGDHCVKQENVGMIAEPFVSPPIKIEDTDSIIVLASDGVSLFFLFLFFFFLPIFFYFSNFLYFPTIFFFFVIQLWDVMDGDKAMSLIQDSRNAEWMSRRLINTALADAKCNDNITVMVVVL
jgi:serine/threonine protein phosphatase PrpC